MSYNSALTYYVMDQAIELFGNETSYGWKTIAIINNEVHHLNDKLINLHTAIEVWQDINNRYLDTSEFELVMLENILKLIEKEEKEKSNEKN